MAATGILRLTGRAGGLLTSPALVRAALVKAEEGEREGEREKEEKEKED